MPEPALAPVIAPVIVPTVHVNVLAAVAVNAKFGPVPLQVASVAALFTAGFGFTVTVIVKAGPAHKAPAVEEGVTMYCMVLATALLGLVSVWLILEPEPALEPVMPPGFDPIVHAKVLASFAVNVIPVAVPLQSVAVAALVTVGA